MRFSLEKLLLTALLTTSGNSIHAQTATPVREQVQAQVEQQYPSLFELYKYLHSHPELSFQERNSSAKSGRGTS